MIYKWNEREEEDRRKESFLSFRWRFFIKYQFRHWEQQPFYQKIHIHNHSDDESRVNETLWCYLSRFSHCSITPFPRIRFPHHVIIHLFHSLSSLHFLSMLYYDFWMTWLSFSMISNPIWIISMIQMKWIHFTNLTIRDIFGIEF